MAGRRSIWSLAEDDVLLTSLTVIPAMSTYRAMNGKRVGRYTLLSEYLSHEIGVYRTSAQVSNRLATLNKFTSYDLKNLLTEEQVEVVKQEVKNYWANLKPPLFDTITSQQDSSEPPQGSPTPSYKTSSSTTPEPFFDDITWQQDFPVAPQTITTPSLSHSNLGLLCPLICLCTLVLYYSY
ncbi:hypothetical protein BC941DRAFT_435219 [Chlamydoabsidia padenii]|nr:hypothetical protein BC941DRAFT_435219 [Chlamydoabsidia padenii]